MRPERARHKLHDGLTEAIGDENASTLMEMLPPFPWHEIARKDDVAALRSAMETKLDALETKIDAIDIKFEGKLDSMFARIVLANLGLVIAIFGLLLAAIKLGI